MLNLLIVDDEPMFREGLVKTIDWESMDVRVAAEAYDGREALNRLEKGGIDLVLTDIRMPGIDGLDLIRRSAVLKNRPGFIVLSAYDNFHQVKEAFQLGIVDYILKSEICQEDLARIIERQKALLSPSAPADALKRYRDDKERLFLQQLLRNCVERKMDPLKIPEITSLNIADGKEPVCCAYVQFHFLGIGDSAGSAVPLSEDWWGSEAHRVGYWESPRSCVLFASGGSDRNWKGFSVECGELQAGLTADPGMVGWEVTVGFSCTDGSPARAKHEAEEAANHSFFRGTGRVIGYNQYQESLDRPRIDTEDVFRRFAPLLDQGFPINESPAEFMVNPHRCSGGQRDDIRRLYQRFHFALQSYGDRQGLASCSPVGAQLNLFPLMEKEKASLERYNSWLRETWSLIRRKMEKSLSLSAKAVRYMESHYREDFSLVDAAEALEVNASYLSRAFSQETGKGFALYLMEIRVRKAIELMESTNLRFYEISEQVGFQNPESFSRSFKKVTGVSPRRYLS